MYIWSLNIEIYICNFFLLLIDCYISYATYHEVATEKQVTRGQQLDVEVVCQHTASTRHLPNARLQMFVHLTSHKLGILKARQRSQICYQLYMYVGGSTVHTYSAIMPGNGIKLQCNQTKNFTWNVSSQKYKATQGN